MNARAWSILAPFVALLAACETTGNPRQGGLFGWSETKARERQAEQTAEVAAAEAKLASERRHGAELARREAGTSRQLGAASSANRRTTAQLREREAAVAAKAAQLEKESPTAATASRARRLRMEVDAVTAARSLSDAERARQLHDLEAEIDAARANIGR